MSDMMRQEFYRTHKAFRKAGCPKPTSLFEVFSNPLHRRLLTSRFDSFLAMTEASKQRARLGPGGV